MDFDGKRQTLTVAAPNAFVSTVLISAVLDARNDRVALNTDSLTFCDFPTATTGKHSLVPFLPQIV